MNWHIFWITFGTIFLAEMGDKTQLAALTMSAETRLPISVFAGACTALCLVTLLGVTLGSFLPYLIPQALLKKLAGAGFIVIGVLIFLGKW
jgi:putative Ca2+/H+ antiporter (TMEM165/GDT1 family)